MRHPVLKETSAVARYAKDGIKTKLMRGVFDRTLGEGFILFILRERDKGYGVTVESTSDFKDARGRLFVRPNGDFIDTNYPAYGADAVIDQLAGKEFKNKRQATRAVNVAMHRLRKMGFVVGKTTKHKYVA